MSSEECSEKYNTPTSQHLVLIPTDVPEHLSSEMDFLDSTFFSQGVGRMLPTAEEVRARAPASSFLLPDPPPVTFPELRLLVKWGPVPQVTPHEALCLRALRTTFGDKFPVPEVFGWRVVDDVTFIYMCLIDGTTLNDRWPDLTDTEKAYACGHLRNIITALRSVRQGPSDTFIGTRMEACHHRMVLLILKGSLNRGAVLDTFFRWEKLNKTAFPDVKTFQDWYSTLPQMRMNFPPEKRFVEPYRQYLPDDGPITFTHADLHRGNVIVARNGPPRILAILDWAQSGWYPDYWEYGKAQFLARQDDEWLQKYIPMFLMPRETEAIVMCEYAAAIGGLV
jgi:hypothetical protein